MTAQQKRRLYLGLTALGPLCAIGCAFQMLAGDFALAWLFGLGIPLAMEGRVLVGGRMPASFLKKFHIACAVLFFIALSALAVGYRPAPLRDAAVLMLLITFAAALPLWYAGIRAVQQKSAQEIAVTAE